ncbi:dicarboxylate/amino acid:cation symporter [Sporosarcina koreensis]|uniref:dicarboxylate/amino acid:cation symporter n=1 Tax=Sporosarcina koreensis TaxID=334735 RepID=UPI0006937960|nr:dicarboxylate/amino acid:cation symporter [Sporosarcina koreensis]
MLKKLWRGYRDSSFVLKMTVGFGAGIISGLLFREKMAVFQPLGTLLINLLSLVAIPVIFLTVVLAVDQMSIRQLGRIGWKLVLYYAATTAAAVGIGVGLALLFQPGKHLTLPNTMVDTPAAPNFSDVLFQLVPSNMFEAFSGGNVMGIIFLAVIIGLAISAMKFAEEPEMRRNGELLDRVIVALKEMFSKLLTGVLLYAPIGVFAISATAFGSQGGATFKSLLAFTAVFYLGITLLWLLVYTSFLRLSGNSVIDFFKSTKEAYTTAFFTSSSIASLPVAIKAAQKAGVSEKTANFALPLGAVFNSDGGALRMGVSIVFAANITNLELSVSSFFVIVIVGTLLSIGTAGVPAAGLVTLAAVLTMFGLPLEIVALIAGVDAIIGMGGTASNVTGDLVGAAVVDKSERKRAVTES